MGIIELLKDREMNLQDTYDSYKRNFTDLELVMCSKENRELHAECVRAIEILEKHLLI